VVVLDETGRAVYVHSGPLGPAEVEEAFQTLAKLLKVELPPPGNSGTR
jgi:predicted transcriptional regulator